MEEIIEKDDEKNSQSVNNQSQIHVQSNQKQAVSSPLKKQQLKPVQIEGDISLLKRRLYFLAEFTFSVTVMILSIVVYYNYYNYNDPNSVVNDHLRLLNNWYSDVITDIQVLSSSQSCPQGFEHMVDYNFAGLSGGCDCTAAQASSQFLDNIYKDSCSQQQLSQGCTDKSGVGSRQLSLLKYSVDFKNICIKRLKGTNFVVLDDQLQGCPSGTRLCGSSIRSYQLCIVQGESCPINGLTLNQSPGVEFSEYVEIISGGTRLYFSRSFQGNAIVEFRVSQGRGVCLNNWVQNRVQGRVIHAWSLDEQKSACEQIDERFEKIEGLSNTETSFYEANQLGAVLSGMPKSDLLINGGVYINFYYRRIIQISDKCREDQGEVVSSQNTLEKIHLFQFILLIGSFVYLGLGWLVLGIYFYFYRNVKGYSWFLIVFKSCIFLVQGIFICMVYFVMQDFKDFVNKMIEEQCFTQTESIAMWKSYQKIILENIFPYCLANLLLFSMMCLVQLAAIFEVCGFKLQNQKKVLEKKEFEKNQTELKKIESQKKYLEDTEANLHPQNTELNNTNNFQKNQQHFQQFSPQQQYISEGAKTPRMPINMVPGMNNPNNKNQAENSNYNSNLNEILNYNSENNKFNSQNQMHLQYLSEASSNGNFQSTGIRKNNNFIMQQRQQGQVPAGHKPNQKIIYEEGQENLQSPNFASKQKVNPYTQQKINQTGLNTPNNNFQNTNNQNNKINQQTNQESVFDSYFQQYQSNQNNNNKQFEHIIKNVNIEENYQPEKYNQFENQNYQQNKPFNPQNNNNRFVVPGQIQYQQEPHSPEIQGYNLNKQNQKETNTQNFSHNQQINSYNNYNIQQQQQFNHPNQNQEIPPLSSKRFGIPQYGQELEDEYDLPQYSPHIKQ